MKPHELLRQAALILTDGWSHNTNARDDTGRIVPLFAGSGRSAINPAATKFSPYGAICKAASQSPKAQMTPAMWDVLQRLAREMGGRGQHPLSNLNEQEGVELTEGRALRQAALILTDGWSHNTNARDDTGRIVPLFAGSGRSAINPAATKFSPYGAICKAASQMHVNRAKGGIESVHPLRGPEFRALRPLQGASPYVFVTEAGTTVTTSWFLRMVQRTGQAAKLPFPVHPHMLRHSTGYKLANDGADTRSLAHYLGHRNLQSTARYTALAPDRFAKFWQD
jgi:hypothetical protein